MKFRPTLAVATALLALTLVAPGFAEAKSRSVIKANANGKFKANINKQALYTAGIKELIIAAAQQKGRIAKVLTITCAAVDLVPGPIADCELIYTYLAPLKGITRTWTANNNIGAVSVVINGVSGNNIDVSFEASGPANDSTNGESLTVTGGVVKLAAKFLD